jgi:CxxC motif-containing protein
MKEVFTSLVRVKGDKNNNVVSVKSSKEIDRTLFLEFSKVLGRIYVSTPIKIGDIICKNILNTGVDIISTKSIKKDNVDNNTQDR